MNSSASLTLKKLIFLVSIFIFGFLILIGTHLFFLNLEEELDSNTKNLKAKIEIGERIVDDLNEIKSNFYELTATSTNRKSRILITKKLNDKIHYIKDSLEVLQHGGTLIRVINLNLLDKKYSYIDISYKKDEKSLPLEVIDITPKLLLLEKMVAKALKLIEQKDKIRKTTKFQEYLKKEKQIQRFYKRTPAFFTRMIENANRLLHEENIELTKINKQIKEEKRLYLTLESLLVIIIFVFVSFLSYTTAVQINANARRLEYQRASVRNILDSQPNIVLVYNNDKIVDANSSLIKFFSEYNDFKEFKNKYNCISEFFEDIDNENYIKDEKNWLENIIEDTKTQHKIAINKDNQLHHFMITAKKKVFDRKNKLIIVNLNDISNEIKVQDELINLNDTLEFMVNKKTKELKELNETLEIKVETEIIRNRQKDQKLIQQSRYAALGEMIGNIAHQWRQPLSAISSTASSMQLQLALDMTTKKEIDESYKTIVSYVEFLSQTIEDFRSFFKKDKEKEEFDMLDILKNTLGITNASYKESHVKVTLDVTKDKSFISLGFPSELSQVFLNILNNAKDALKDITEEERNVYIHVYTKNNKNFIEICDNAGGVPASIKDKIFDPYFTTKHKSQGTGIGLYMSKDIIEKHMNGNLYIENKIKKINDKNYRSACFIVSLPELTPNN